jgi:hypothetical protein
MGTTKSEVVLRLVEKRGTNSEAALGIIRSVMRSSGSWEIRGDINYDIETQVSQWGQPSRKLFWGLSKNGERIRRLLWGLSGLSCARLDITSCENWEIRGDINFQDTGGPRPPPPAAPSEDDSSRVPVSSVRVQGPIRNVPGLKPSPKSDADSASALFRRCHCRHVADWSPLGRCG